MKKNKRDLMDLAIELFNMTAIITALQTNLDNTDQGLKMSDADMIGALGGISDHIDRIGLELEQLYMMKGVRQDE